MLTTKIAINPIYDCLRRTAEYIADHKASRVVLGILPHSKTIHAFHDIFTGETGISCRHSLAFDDRVRIVLTRTRVDTGQI